MREIGCEESFSTCFCEDEIFTIRNDDDFLKFADTIDRGKSFSGVTVILETDIDTSKFENFTDMLGKKTAFEGLLVVICT